MKPTLLLPLLALALSSCAALGTSSTREVVQVAQASGGAWSAAKLAREAMESIDGIADLRMAGTRATFTLRKGAELDRDEVADAFEERGMKLESLETVRRPRAKAVYRVGAGVGWASTIGKVRAALLEIDGVIDAYFEDRIEVLVVERSPQRLERIEAVLAEHEIATASS